MRKLLVLFVFLFTLLLTYTVIAQKMGAIEKSIEYSFPEKIQNPVLDPLPAGTYSVGLGGYFSTIDSAFNKLSIDGVSGDVTLELINTLYIAPSDSFGFFLNGPIPGAGPTNRVTIKPAANKNVTIEGSGLSTVLFLNTNYVTVDGIGLTGTTTLTIHSIFNPLYSYNDGIDFVNNSDHNVIQNIIFICDDITRIGSGPGFYSLTGSEVAPDSNLIQNNYIKKAGTAIFISSLLSTAAARAKGNIIRGNTVGSETDSLIAWGIQLEKCQNTIVENNIVQKIRFYNDNINPGINSYWGNGDIIRNNVVHNIYTSGGLYGGIGILLSGGSTRYGSNNLVYNNMIYDIRSSSLVPQSAVAGIQMWNQNNPKIYYNSVYLNGNGNGANSDGSAALYIYNNCTNVDARNNIFVNTRNESPFRASAIQINSGSSLNISNFNDLYYSTGTNNCLVRMYGVNYNTLAQWQATGKDLNSITEMPNFKDPYLHIDEMIGTYLESGATPIAGIDSDFDGELRNVSMPDIGADEFGGFTPVELTSFTATTNGNEIILSWSTATELNNQGFEIERASSETSPRQEDWVKIGFVPGFGTTTEPKSYSYTDQSVNRGTFYYRLKQVDYDGSYEYSEVVEIEITSPTEFALEQNFPNPFNPLTTIGFSIQNKSNVKITVLNAIGEQVAIVLNEEKEPGFHQVEFSAANLPSGVYFYRLQAGSFMETKKMLLLK